jgi:hypothetical protein
MTPIRSHGIHHRTPDAAEAALRPVASPRDVAARA